MDWESGPFVVTDIVGKPPEWVKYLPMNKFWMLIGITAGFLSSDRPLNFVDLPPNHGSDRRRPVGMITTDRPVAPKVPPRPVTVLLLMSVRCCLFQLPHLLLILVKAQS